MENNNEKRMWCANSKEPSFHTRENIKAIFVRNQAIASNEKQESNVQCKNNIQTEKKK